MDKKKYKKKSKIYQIARCHQQATNTTDSKTQQKIHMDSKRKHLAKYNKVHVVFIQSEHKARDTNRVRGMIERKYNEQSIMQTISSEIQLKI